MARLHSARFRDLDLITPRAAEATAVRARLWRKLLLDNDCQVRIPRLSLDWISVFRLRHCLSVPGDATRGQWWTSWFLAGLRKNEVALNDDCQH